MSESRQISVRLSEPVYDGLEQRAHWIGESRNSLVERYVAEGLRRDTHPLITFRDGALGRRAALAGTRLDVWQVIETLRTHGNSVAQATSYLDIPPAVLRAAVAYYAEYSAETDDIAEREAETARRAEDAWRAEQAILAG